MILFCPVSALQILGVVSQALDMVSSARDLQQMSSVLSLLQPDASPFQHQVRLLTPPRDSSADPGLAGQVAAHPTRGLRSLSFVKTWLVRLGELVRVSGVLTKSDTSIQVENFCSFG